MRTSWIALGITVGLTGCTTHEASLPNVEQLEQGVTILDADPVRGVVAAYREGDHVVYLETRVGNLKPAIYRESDPDDPAHEMDMMIVDKHGVPFYVQRGGDVYVDPTWNEKLAIAKSRPTIADHDRNLDFALAQKLGQEFPRIADHALADHTFHIQVMGSQPTPAENPVLKERAQVILSTPLPTDRDQPYWSGSGWWYAWPDVHKKCIYLCAGEHSAVANWQWRDGGSSWSLVEQYCNHGTCATGMSRQCSRDYGWKYNPSHTGEYSQSTWVSGAGCATRYDWWGGSNTHLCNDDTAYEMMQIKEGRVNTSLGGQWNFNWGNYSCNVGRGKWSSPGCGQ
jgi:hypothetical protein